MFSEMVSHTPPDIVIEIISSIMGEPDEATPTAAVWFIGPKLFIAYSPTGKCNPPALCFRDGVTWLHAKEYIAEFMLVTGKNLPVYSDDIASLENWLAEVLYFFPNTKGREND